MEADKETAVRVIAQVMEPIQMMRARSTADRHVFQAAPTVERPGPAQHPGSVAVLPFRPASAADGGLTYLAEGLTEDVIHELNRFKRPFDAVPDVTGDITARVVATVSGRIDNAEIKAACWFHLAQESGQSFARPVAKEICALSYLPVPAAAQLHVA